MKKLFPIIISGAVAVVLLLGALGMSLDFKTSAPEKTAKKFMTCFAKGNFQKAAKYMDSSSEETMYLMELMGGGNLNINYKFDVLTGTPEYSADGLTAYVPMAATTIGSVSGVEEGTLKKVGNKWLVSDFDF